MNFESLFSIKDFRETHKLIQILGIKIKFPKRDIARKKKENPYYYYKKNNIDITTLPPATGQTRDIQLANLALLKELDRICKEQNLRYWLFAGSALGAIRHKGYIPWDDDLDVAMPREDYDRIIDIFNNNTHNKNLHAVMHKHTKTGLITKIRHKHCSHIFVDIFAVDFCNKIIESKEQQIVITNSIKKDRLKISNNNKQEILALRKKYISDNPIENSDILLGLEWGHSEKNWFIKYNSVFPLTKTKFEGMEFFSMAHPEDYLTDYYGNYMGYPPKITTGHSMYLKLSRQEKNTIANLIKELNQ